MLVVKKKKEEKKLKNSPLPQPTQTQIKSIWTNKHTQVQKVALCYIATVVISSPKF